MRVAGYRDIVDYGLIGDGRTAALVAADGSIDWFCWPRFDSPSVFARLLHAERGGFWQVAPVDAHVDGAMRYRPQTAILETEHRTASGRVRVTDAAAAPELGRGHTRIVRLVEGLEGERLTDGGLVYRYRGADDGLPGEEGTFTICTLWLASAMAVCGRVAEAREVFERVLSYAGPLGLFSEEIDPRTGAALSNYPQAFTHIGLIGAPVHLARAGVIDARAGADIGLPGVQGSEARARVGEDAGPRRRGARFDAHEHQQGGLADG